MKSALKKYLEKVKEQNRYIDSKGVGQMQQIVKLDLDEVYVQLTASFGNTSVHRYEKSWEKDYENILIRTAQNQEGMTKKSRNVTFKSTGDDLLDEERIATELKNQEEHLTVEELLQRQNQWAILGDPGAGKTTVLKHLAYVYAKKLLDGEKTLVPVPVVLRFFGAYLEKNRNLDPKEALFAYIASQGLAELAIPEKEIPETTKALKEAFQEGNCLLLLDGLDEQHTPALKQRSTAAIELFLKEHEATRCVVTSRIVGYDEARLQGDFAQATLEPFTLEQRNDFFSRWHKAVEVNDQGADDDYTTQRAQERTETLISQLDAIPGAAQLASNPLLCTIISLVYHQTASLPPTRAELYKFCVDTFIFNWETQKRKDRERTSTDLNSTETQQALEIIALHIMEECPENRIAGDELKKLVADWLVEEEGVHQTDAEAKAERLLFLIRKVAGLLVDKGNNEHGFFHLTFQEYLAARRICRKQERKKAYINKYLYIPRWREVIRLASAHMGTIGQEQGTDFIKLILKRKHARDDFMEYTFRFGFLCMLETPVEFTFEDKILARWIACWQEKPWLREKLISLSQRSQRLLRCRPATLAPFTEALKDEDEDVRRSAAYALGSLKAGEAVQPLIEAMKDEDEDVRRSAAEALTPPPPIEQLVPLLDKYKTEALVTVLERADLKTEI